MRRGKKLKRVQKPKVSNLELNIFFRILGRYFHVVERHTTVRLRHDARRTSSQSASARSGRHNISNCETKSREKNFFVVLLPSEQYLRFSPLFWALVEGYIFVMPETGT